MYLLMARYQDEPFMKIYQTKQELLEGLSDFDPHIPLDNYFDSLEDGDIDFDEFPAYHAVLIKGKCVSPIAKQVVTEFEVE